MSVPPQLKLFVVLTTRPDDSVPLNPIPVSVIAAAFGFVIVKFSVSGPFRFVLLRLADCVTVGGPMTVKVACEVLPVPPFVELT